VADAHVSNIADHVQLGQTVMAYVTDIDTERSRAVLSLKPSQTATTDASYLSNLFVDKVIVFMDYLIYFYRCMELQLPMLAQLLATS